MARTKSTVYSGKLELDKVTSMRLDTGKPMTYVPVKKNKTLPESKKSMAIGDLKTRDGLKK